MTAAVRRSTPLYFAAGSTGSSTLRQAESTPDVLAARDTLQNKQLLCIKLVLLVLVEY